ncbi:uncharacterized protein LOC128957056 [Oppia nitens]|uniref:uncharacterized protein LOC128957056 n=1 Tax=Oppia nitens TaxID=1686743 RepID=UPI0023DBBF57|nr:uncharacterized protein LOC128957056 [Oppia nitens]
MSQQSVFTGLLLWVVVAAVAVTMVWSVAAKGKAHSKTHTTTTSKPAKHRACKDDIWDVNICLAHRWETMNLGLLFKKDNDYLKRQCCFIWESHCAHSKLVKKCPEDLVQKKTDLEKAMTDCGNKLKFTVNTENCKKLKPLDQTNENCKPYVPCFGTAIKVVITTPASADETTTGADETTTGAE